jgi:hypothetical protein
MRKKWMTRMNRSRVNSEKSNKYRAHIHKSLMSLLFFFPAYLRNQNNRHALTHYLSLCIHVMYFAARRRYFGDAGKEDMRTLISKLGAQQYLQTGGTSLDSLATAVNVTGALDQVR